MLAYHAPNLAYAESETALTSPFSELPEPGSSMSNAQGWLEQHCQTPPTPESAANPDPLKCDNFVWQGQQVSLTLFPSNGLLGTVNVEGIRSLLPNVLAILDQHELAEVSTKRVVYFPSLRIAVEIPRARLTLFSHSEFNRLDLQFRTQASQEIELNLSKKQWLEDLEALDKYIRKDHVHPFGVQNEQGYRQRYALARDAILTSEVLDSAQINAHFEALVSYTGDGHSHIIGMPSRLGRYPYYLRWYNEQLVIRGVNKDNRHLLGASVLAIGGLPLSKAVDLISAYIPTPNDSALRANSEYALAYSALLYSAGISDHSDKIELTLKLQNGDISDYQFTLAEKVNREFIQWLEPQVVKNSLVSKLDNDQKNAATLIENEVLYVRYKSVQEKQPGSISQLADKIDNMASRLSLKKVIIDIRDNEGGNSYLNSSLIAVLSKNRNINQYGKLYVLVNRNTFSAAINFAGAMEWQTAAIFVGEPPGDRPIFAGEAGPQAIFELPNSKILLSLSFSEWIATVSFDTRHEITVDHYIDQSLDEFLNGTDSVLNWAINFTPDEDLPNHTTIKNLRKWTGYYSIDEIDTLQIYAQDGQLYLNLPGLIYSGVYLNNIDNKAHTDIRGFVLGKNEDGSLDINFNNRTYLLKKTKDHLQSPIRSLMYGERGHAKTRFQYLFKKHPSDLRLRGNYLGILASKLRERHNEANLYKEIRNIAESMHGTTIKSWDRNDEKI